MSAKTYSVNKESGIPSQGGCGASIKGSRLNAGGAMAYKGTRGSVKKKGK